MIQILITGGTFEKSYNHINGELFFKKTHLPEMLDRSKCRLKVKVKTLMMIDSLQMTKKDIESIINECEKCKSERIVITHGTDTMTDTARELGLKKLNKTIVLTGAMIPYKFGTSDGLFNIASALAYVQTLTKGVYVAMNGRVFTYDKVIKNKDTGIFEEIIWAI